MADCGGWGVGNSQQFCGWGSNNCEFERSLISKQPKMRFQVGSYLGDGERSKPKVELLLEIEKLIKLGKA